MLPIAVPVLAFKRVFPNSRLPGQRGPEVLHFSRRKMLSINHLYAFCRAKQGASAPIMQTQKEVSAVKSWRAQGTAMRAKIYVGSQMRMTLGIFSAQVKVGKKCMGSM